MNTKIVAQQGFVVAGGDVSNSNGSASFSFGQIDYTVANNNTMSFGVQQAFDSSKPLPAKIIEFTAHKKDSIVLINWTVTNQINCKNFIVERSLNGKEFNVAIRSTHAINNNQSTHYYSCKDLKPQIGFNYYRLKTIDVTGNIAYSQIILIKFSVAQPSIVLYPNPTQNIIKINIGFEPKANDNVVCELYGVEGNKILSYKLVSMLTPLDLSKRPTGIYFLKINNNATNIITLNKGVISKHHKI